MLQRMIGEDVVLTCDRAADLRPVRADPGQIEQIIMNLAVNARDAMPQGGELTIQTANVERNDLDGPPDRDRPARPYVLLTVTDTGCGMDEKTKARLFEPFFTTKEVGKGTGLGLATIFGIIKQSDGHIEVQSEPGRGTTFKIYLPCVEGPVPVEPPAQPAPADDPRAEGAAGADPCTVLLVEDEDWVRSLVRQVLQRQGYQVVEARHGAEALQIWETRKDHIRLMITDVVMPQMNGSDLAQRLLDQRPDLKVLFMSGYTDAFSNGMRHKGAAFLHKPFMPKNLCNKVRELLEV
jgi:CheY-like chemotaxis protein